MTGYDALLHSIMVNDEKSIAALLDEGKINVNQPFGNDGWTFLHLAAQKGNARVVKMLLDHGAKPDAKNKGGLTPLEVAKQHEDARAAADVLRSQSATP